MNNEKVNNLSMCPVKAKHTEFLFKVFTQSRPDLALIDAVNDEEKATIIYQQFKMEEQQFIEMYPEGEFNIVMLNNLPIGRLYIHNGEKTDRILQIGLVEKYRSMGIGKKLVTRVTENALKKGKTVSLQVAWFNQGAYKFYEKLGFKVVENKGVSYEMHYI